MAEDLGSTECAGGVGAAVPARAANDRGYLAVLASDLAESQAGGPAACGAGAPAAGRGLLRRLGAVGAAAAAVGVLCVVFGARSAPDRPLAAPALRASVSLVTLAASSGEKRKREGCESCCLTYDDVMFPGNDLAQVEDVDTAGECCSLCRDHETCLAWTWAKSGAGNSSRVCFLKGGYPRPVTRVPSTHYKSGLTTQGDKLGAPMQAIQRAVGQSLYCFALIQPQGYEKGLIAMQFEEQASIFECDEYGMFSNRRMELVTGVFTSVVNSTLHCSMGGEFGTALNTGIFLAVWTKVVEEGRFLYHDWTVKVDPDAVFLPSRIRNIVKDYRERETGVYLNNCKFGMHGPLEVFSRNAVKTWASGAGECVEYFWKLCSGPCGWGEDMFIDQCMKRKLNVHRVDDYRQLYEDHCAPPDGWDDCANGTIAAFHPFKQAKSWKKCLSAARASSKSEEEGDFTALSVQSLEG